MARRRKFRRNKFVKRTCPVCNNPTKIRCRYCGNWFCQNHYLPRGLLEKSKNSKLIKYYDPTLGHACYEYKMKKQQEERIKENKWWSTLDRLKKLPGTIVNEEPPTPETNSSSSLKTQRPPRIRISRRHIRTPRLGLQRTLRRPFAWYVIYITIVFGLNYLTTNYTNIYLMVAPIFKYPFYVVSAFLGGYIPYRLFKHYEYKEPHSDLQMWLWRLLAGLFAFVSVIILFLGFTFLFATLLSLVGRELGYGLTIFFGVLFLGTTLFSGYLMFKYKIRSGVIIHRGEGW